MTEADRFPATYLLFLKEKVVAILGYNQEGFAQACHLRANGIRVIVSLRQGSSSELWEQADFPLVSLWDAAEQADVFQVW